MNTDLALFVVFGAVSVLHHYAEKHFAERHYHIHWLGFVLHPVTFLATKDWLIHIVVYSKYALLGTH